MLRLIWREIGMMVENRIRNFIILMYYMLVFVLLKFFVVIRMMDRVRVRKQRILVSELILYLRRLVFEWEGEVDRVEWVCGLLQIIIVKVVVCEVMIVLVQVVLLMERGVVLVCLLLLVKVLVFIVFCCVGSSFKVLVNLLIFLFGLLVVM